MTGDNLKDGLEKLKPDPAAEYESNKRSSREGVRL